MNKVWFKMRCILQKFRLRMQQNKLSQAAGYLTYSTMLAIVPLIMVVFSIFSLFPIFNEITGELKAFLFTNFAPSASDVVGYYLDQFVENAKKMSLVGMVSLIVVALLLIHSIDRTLNTIWQNTTCRSILFSFAIYCVILTLGPLLIGLSIGVSSYLSAVVFQENFPLPFRLKWLNIVPFFLTWFIFTLIYTLVPNCRVRISHAAVGALMAAFFFTLGKQAFVWYIATFPSYQLIYGAMATLPLMLLWVQLSWTVVLAGAQLAAVLGEVNQTIIIEEGINK